MCVTVVRLCIDMVVSELDFTVYVCMYCLCGTVLVCHRLKVCPLFFSENFCMWISSLMIEVISECKISCIDYGKRQKYGTRCGDGYKLVYDLCLCSELQEDYF